MKINFINHAGFFCEANGVNLLIDPWLDGTAFNDGWSLTSRSVTSLDDLATATHIWISHEHPDHFRPGTLSKIPIARRNEIFFLFQRTIDRKVINFCSKLGFKTIEVEDGKYFNFNDHFKIRCEKSSIYDSWILLETPLGRILNLNDSPIRSAAAISLLKKKVGNIDVLMTQFNYAGWRGNPEDSSKRILDAKEKQKTVAKQIALLNPRYCIPFASFSYFCHEDNAFMNAESNSPMLAVETIEQTSTIPILLYPGDTWTVGAHHNNDAALYRYNKDYQRIKNEPLLTSNSIPFKDLQQSAQEYREQKLQENSKLFFFLLQLIPFVHFLEDLTIELVDTNIVACFSFKNDQALRRVDQSTKNYILRMRSDSLNFIFAHDWGIDTLAANARFYADRGGLWHLIATFGIGVLNNSGIYLNHRLFRNFTSLKFLLVTVIKKLART